MLAIMCVVRVLTYLYTCKDVVVLCKCITRNTLNTPDNLTIKALMTGLPGFSGWVSPVQYGRRIRRWHHLVTGIKRTVVIWPGSRNDQMRRYIFTSSPQRDTRQHVLHVFLHCPSWTSSFYFPGSTLALRVTTLTQQGENTSSPQSCGRSLIL